MKKLLSTALIISALAASAFAGTYKLPKENPIASIAFPDDWKVKVEDESVDAESADEEVSIYVEFNDAGSIEGAIQEIFGYLKKEKVTIDKSTEKKTEAKFKGMDVVNYDWDGEDEDGKCKISVAIIGVTPKRGLLLLYWASPAGEKKHEKALAAIQESITSLAK
jgi:hypothetical protein